jgi:hypothetical protein
VHCGETVSRGGGGGGGGGGGLSRRGASGAGTSIQAGEHVDNDNNDDASPVSSPSHLGSSSMNAASTRSKTKKSVSFFEPLKYDDAAAAAHDDEEDERAEDEGVGRESRALFEGVYDALSHLGPTVRCPTIRSAAVRAVSEVRGVGGAGSSAQHIVKAMPPFGPTQPACNICCPPITASTNDAFAFGTHYLHPPCHITYRVYVTATATSLTARARGTTGWRGCCCS